MIRPLALLFFAVGCGPKLDPLHPMKQEIGKARRSAAPANAPHARLTVASDTLGAVIQSATLNPDKPIRVPLFMGSAAIITPRLRPFVLKIRQSPTCDCPRAIIKARGAVDIDMSGLLGKQRLADDLGFRATARGAPKLSIGRAGPKAAQVISLEPVAEDGWSVDIKLDESAGMITDELVRQQVSVPVGELLSRPLPLVTLPAELPVKVKKIDLEVADDPTAAIWIRGRPSKAAPPIDVDEGWGVSLTESGLTSVARAMAGSVKQHPKWQVEPVNITVDNGTWDADIRVHKVARRVKYRDYHVSGRLKVGKKKLKVLPETTKRTASKGWKMSLTGLFLDGAVKKRVSSMALETDATIERKLGASNVTLKVEDVRSQGENVFVTGSIE